MKTREQFETLRRMKIKFSLRSRLTLTVTAEIIFCVILALSLDRILETCFPDIWKMPLLVDLIIFSCIIGLVVTSVLSRMFFDPIKRLREAMGRVADGDFGVELSTKSNSKEIQEIYSGFNLMTQELQSMEILRTDFISNASHEFKTPVSAITGYTDLLSSCEDLTPEHREYIEKIQFNTRRLSSLTRGILLMSKLESQQIATNQSRFLLDEQIRQSIVALESQWDAKKLELDVDLCEAAYYGNELLMRHVWDNLISNAVKFSPDGGLIGIRLKKSGGSILFTVEDSGPGIPDDAIRHIFNKFYQADSVHKQEGSGLGLALVDRILKLEGGTVRAENRAEGGCRFVVTLCGSK